MSLNQLIRKISKTYTVTKLCNVYKALVISFAYIYIILSRTVAMHSNDEDIIGIRFDFGKRLRDNTEGSTNVRVGNDKSASTCYA